jgi:hypothetical protein
LAEKPKRRTGRRFSRRSVILGVISLVIFLGVLIGLNGCVATIEPPSLPSDPCRVYLLRSAYHVGIVLPDSEGGLVEYGYGDWDWYALMYDKWYNIFGTLFWPTQGCLCRRKVSPQASPDRFPGGELETLTVSEAKAKELMSQLEDRFRKNASTLMYNSTYGLEFVHDERDFWVFFNCHDAVADWFIDLGCEVTWYPIRMEVELAALEE